MPLDDDKGWWRYQWCWMVSHRMNTLHQLIWLTQFIFPHVTTFNNVTVTQVFLHSWVIQIRYFSQVLCQEMIGNLEQAFGIVLSVWRLSYDSAGMELAVEHFLYLLMLLKCPTYCRADWSWLSWDMIRHIVVFTQPFQLFHCQRRNVFVCI